MQCCYPKKWQRRRREAGGCGGAACGADRCSQRCMEIKGRSIHTCWTRNVDGESVAHVVVGHVDAEVARHP